MSGSEDEITIINPYNFNNKLLTTDFLNSTLKEFGVKKETFFQSIDTMATQAIASGSPNNNPIVPSHDELVSLYKNLWS